MTDDQGQRMLTLLDELFDLDAELRAVRLAQVEADEPELANQLRRALVADERSGLLDAGAGKVAATLMSELAVRSLNPASRNERKGGQLGHYRLVERVASGGMGEVWRGERVDDFEQDVAIKLIHPFLDSPQLRERFARERQILARLQHPNIARLLDGGVSADGAPWYAMEFVHGSDIVRYARDHTLGIRARIELMLQVIDAVAHAQAQLVVHRDLKPSNVLVDAQGRAHVLDFGIARLLDDSANLQLTGTGMRLFSTAYAAPEQILGQPVGTAADVFALGALLFELLTGGVPHPERSAAPDRLITQLADEAAPRPSQALRQASNARAGTHAHTATRELAGDLDTIVATALQPEAARRYVGAAQLGDDLRRWLDGHPIAARPDTTGYRMRKFVQRHRIAVGSASAVLLALIAGLGIALWQASIARQHAVRADAEAARANLEARRAAQQTVQAKKQVERTKKVKEFLVSILQQADPMVRDERGPLSIDAAFEQALERAKTELASDPVLQADVLDDFGEIRANQGRLDDAEELFKQAARVAEAEYGPQHPVLAESLINLGAIQGFRGNYPSAAPYADRAIAILEKDDGGDPLAIVNALSLKAAVAQQRGDAAAMRAIADRVLQLVRQYAAEDDQRLLVAISNVAMMDQRDGKLDAAEAGFHEAIGLVEGQQGLTSPNLYPNLVSLADIAYARGQFEKSAEMNRRALAIAQKNFPQGHRWLAQSLINVGDDESRAGQVEQGEARMREGIALYQELGSPYQTDGLRLLALSQGRRNDLQAALATLRDAWDICRSTQRAEAQTCLVIRANHAHVLARSGHAQQALDEIDALAKVKSLHLEADASDTALRSERAQVWRARAAALSALGRTPEALAAQNRALELLQAEFGEQHPETQTVLDERKVLARL